ncbi:MAG TPA: 4-hydroxy-tetrahydrodipicolinate synthase [Thermoanaerobaculia bacterium]|jgi:4-hydroxy-tetrahydrodipicolinate synthase|nr:4-hydroxy-tetrahydrodipicolinate synthase [Thermoanaerobaculia bacterium]
MSFRGVGTALVTPFTSTGALDEKALERFVDFQIEGGVNFLVPCGTTGENPALTQDEHRRVVEIVVTRAKGRVPVLAGAGSNSTAKAIELAQLAIDLGADGVLTITPYYNKPTPDGLRRHFGLQAEAIEKKRSKFPMIMYNVPGRTGVNMTAATTLQIALEVPNVVGVKEASGNMEQILQIVRDRPKGFVVLSGDDAWTLPLMAVGGDGIISVASNEVPKLMRKMVDERSVEIHNRLLPLLVGNFIESNPIPVKAALKMMRILESDTVRPPLAPITDANRKKLESILRECELL